MGLAKWQNQENVKIDKVYSDHRPPQSVLSARLSSRHIVPKLKNTLKMAGTSRKGCFSSRHIIRLWKPGDRGSQTRPSRGRRQDGLAKVGTNHRSEMASRLHKSKKRKEDSKYTSD